jgi:hypothetical protein
MSVCSKGVLLASFLVNLNEGAVLIDAVSSGFFSSPSL